jgi:glucose repression regulatory protein TUP1
MNDGTSVVLNVDDPDSVNCVNCVVSVAISPNGRYVAAGTEDSFVHIWDLGTTRLIERLSGHTDSVYSVAFTPDGKGLVSGSLDKTLKYWDVSALMRGEEEKGIQCTMNFMGHKVRREFPQHIYLRSRPGSWQDYVLSVAVSHDGRWVASGSKDRGVLLWDSRTAMVQCMLQGHRNSVLSVDLSPTGNVLATGSGDWEARICMTMFCLCDENR